MMRSANYLDAYSLVYYKFSCYLSFFLPLVTDMIALEGGDGEGGGQSLRPRVEKGGRCMGGRKNMGSVNGTREK